MKIICLGIDIIENNRITKSIKIDLYKSNFQQK